MRNQTLLILICSLFFACDISDSEATKDAKDFVGESIKSALLSDSIIHNIRLCTEIPPIGSDTAKKGGKSAGGVIDLLWPEMTKVLLIKFLDGDKAIQEKVKTVAKEWESNCGKKFDFGNHSEPDIAITFKLNGSWSHIGKDSRIVATKNRPSMNFGWLTANTSDEEFKRVVLHEFGHALGLIHEHQNPIGNPIKWNYDAVYQYYKSTQNWDENLVIRNMFSKYSIDQINASNFDSKSIMLYAIPNELTEDDYSVEGNSELSITDKTFIKQLYPKD